MPLNPDYLVALSASLLTAAIVVLVHGWVSANKKRSPAERQEQALRCPHCGMPYHYTAVRHAGPEAAKECPWCEKPIR